MTTLNSVGRQLLAGLSEAARYSNSPGGSGSELINVVGAGGKLTAAYEQLRNAAENAEEHLLLQNAIRRFYKLLVVTRDQELVRTSGNELVVEMTLAGYLVNDSVSVAKADQISEIASRHYATHEALITERRYASDQITGWVLDSLAAQVAGVLSDKAATKVYVNVVLAYFDKILPDFITSDQLKAHDDYRAVLLASIHRALLKSDKATIRAALLNYYGVGIDQMAAFTKLNQQIDRLSKHPLADQLYHIVDRQGAPLRVLKRMIDGRSDLTGVLSRREVFLEAFEQQVNREYSGIMQRVNRAVARSVAFLIITKVLIGVAVEIPYDYWAYGLVEWQPLLINLLFPPLYMVALRLTLNLPGYANTTALVDAIDIMLYGDKVVLRRRGLLSRRYSSVFSVFYAVFGLAVFGAVTWLLLTLHFSVIHIAIFFIFVSAASFLGFRISRLIRDIEITRSASNGLTFVRDIVYLPFVAVGRWMNEQYSQINIIALVLDMVIELPLKTILRLVRQWGMFIDDRKDRI